MPLESRLLNRTGADYEKTKELSTRWRTARDIAKDNTIRLLVHMCNISRDIKSGKKPPLEKTQVALYKIAKEQFNPEMLSMINRYLYFKIVQAINEAYSVAEQYVCEK